jgi:hypothetical protein
MIDRAVSLRSLRENSNGRIGAGERLRLCNINASYGVAHTIFFFFGEKWEGFVVYGMKERGVR